MRKTIKYFFEQNPYPTTQQICEYFKGTNKDVARIVAYKDEYSRQALKRKQKKITVVGDNEIQANPIADNKIQESEE